MHGSRSNVSKGLRRIKDLLWLQIRVDRIGTSVICPQIASSYHVRPTRAEAKSLESLQSLSGLNSRSVHHTPSPHVLQTDIAQFFSSIYTHAIPWSAHGIDAAKADTSDQSPTNVFNQLDFFVRRCQRGETRGVLVGPDAFRLIAEFIAAGIDAELNARLESQIVGCGSPRR